MTGIQKNNKMTMIRQIIISIIIVFSGFIAGSQTIENNLYQKAFSNYSQKQYDKVLSLLNQTNLQLLNDAEFYLFAGDSYFKLNQYEDALKNYNTAFKLKNKPAALKIAECYSYLNKPYKAVEYLKIYLKSPNKLLQSEIKLMPAFTQIESSNAWINLWKENYYNSYEKKLDEAKYQISKGDYATAFDIIDKLIIKNKKRHKAYEMRGDLLLLTKDYKNAATAYLKASEIKKHNLTYKTKAADAFYFLKKYKRAENIYNEIITDKYYNPEILLNKTKNEIEIKKTAEAKQSINLFLSFFPDNAEAYYFSGKIHSSDNENIAALEDFNRSIEKDDSKPEYFISCGDSYLKTKTYKSAVNSYSMALDLNPKLAEVWYKKGVAEIKLYKYAEACEDLKKAKSMNYNKADDLIFKYCK